MLFTRGTSEWITRVNQKHKQLGELGLSAGEKETLDQWAETEFVCATLKLEGADISREQMAQVVSHTGDSAALPENRLAASQLLDSLRVVSSMARAKGRGAELTPEVLLKLHTIPDAGLRTSTVDPPARKPPAPAHLPALIESACQWYTADSFVELNPIEQASIVLLRLIDLQPFEQANERTALVAASLFTMRCELPPIIIKPEMASAYRNALDEGIRMNTKPMVELIAEAINQSINEMIQRVEQSI